MMSSYHIMFRTSLRRPGHSQLDFWWLLDLPYWFKASFYLKFGESSCAQDTKDNFMWSEIQSTWGQIKHWKTWKTEILHFMRFQSELKKIILVKSSLGKVRFKTHKVIFMSHLSDPSLFNIVNIRWNRLTNLTQSRNFWSAVPDLHRKFWTRVMVQFSSFPCNC